MAVRVGPFGFFSGNPYLSDMKLKWIFPVAVAALLASAGPAPARGGKPLDPGAVLYGRLDRWNTGNFVFKGSPQGFAIRGGRAVVVRDRGQVNLLDLKHKKVTDVFFVEGLREAHCNNAGFGREKASRTSLFPLLYVTECYGKHRCYVVDLTPGHGEVLQEIFYDDPEYRGPLDWAVDARAGFIYAYGGPAGARFLKKFRLPALADSDPDGKVVFSAADVLSTTVFDGGRIPQGSAVRRGLAFIPEGCPPMERRLYVIEMESGRQVSVTDLSPLDIEPEGIDVRGGFVYLLFYSRDKVINTNIYRLKIKDLRL